MTTNLRRLTTAETAKLMRFYLKRAFPELPARFFSVRSDVYSGGSSIHVSWTDGPSGKVVDEVVRPFQSTSFDGMTDSTIYIKTALTTPEGETVRSGAGYVFTERTLSPKADAILLRKAAECFGWIDAEVKRGHLEKRGGRWPEHHERVWFSHLREALSLAPNGVAFWNKAHGAPYL